ncbi:ATP-binding protein [Candidatus Pelagibacter sp. HIMB1746]|jgi:two-component system osmolarity sensor histidine kinase EnvZ|uniref:ATP-binding protein n=1 Tax=Candidatus Pelagibacter sp. HIMB1746 TaxID=3413370 RepID=UPI003F85E1C6
MFSGLSNFFKKVLPKRLFYRALLIVAVPVITIQLIITIVFFDSLWIKTNKGMTRTLVNEISAFIEAYQNEENDKQEVNNLFSLFLDLNIELVVNEKLSDQNKERWFSPIDRTLRRELKSKFSPEIFWFNTTNYKELVDLRIKYEDGYFKFLVPKDRVTSTSARIFALWITVPAIIMVIISLIFLKNQTRPITNLARAAERFGKGEDIEEFKPSGALEIRQAGHEFDKMRKRIERHLNQRTEMLSGISHDLRTPLTRMKLQLAFLKDKDAVDKLTDDINEMEKMLNEYLQFTSSSYVEKDEMFNLSELIEEIIKKYNNKNISHNLIPRIYINGRKNLINRSLNNLIDNGLKYANKVEISLTKKNTNLFIIIDDDGPGIPKKEHENVFKPFYKMDKGRNDSKSSVGLGLSIASDIIKSHGGNIMLEKSKFNGLRVKIFLPV